MTKSIKSNRIIQRKTVQGMLLNRENDQYSPVFENHICKITIIIQIAINHLRFEMRNKSLDYHLTRQSLHAN